MSVSIHRLRQATSAAAVTLAVTLALPSAAFAATPRLSACDDLLVTISPGATTGDAYAAAVTAQVLVADVAGWESATWAVADSTDLREVLVLHSDGTTRSVGAQRSGTATDVLALGFCGSTSEGGQAEVEEGDAHATSIDPKPAPEPAPEATPAPAPPEPAEDMANDQMTVEPAATTDEVVEDHLDDRDDGAAEPDDEDVAAAFAGPIGPTTAPYHDAGITNAALTAASGANTLAPSTGVEGVTLVAATATNTSPTTLPAVTGATSDQGASAALVALFTGAGLALVLLGTRRRFTREVHA